MNHPEPIEFPVSGNTNAKQLAGALRQAYRDADPNTEVRLVGIGMPSVNNGVKSIVELNKLLVSTGFYCTALPTLEDRDVTDRNNPDRTVVRTVTILNLQKRRLST